MKSAPHRKSVEKKKSASRALSQRIHAAPCVAKGVGHAVLDGWLASIRSSIHGKALIKLLAGAPTVKVLLVGIAAYSPYLWELVKTDPKRLLELLQSDPDERLIHLLAATKAAMANISDRDKATRLLRRMKAEAALLIAMADIGGVWSVGKVTHALTEIADVAVASAVRFLLAEAASGGKINPIDATQPEKGSGYVVLAMGKMGAFELNYSSDIDIVVFFDPAVSILAPDIDAAALYIRVTRGLVKLLQEWTGDGYVFRVDLRLRPDPASTQIAVSIPAALEYYERRGQNWERSALIKARVCAGDPEAGAALLKELSPFVWRKHMDFAALADIHAMKRQIHAFKGHGEIAVGGHNVKLGRGGIREIEFFAQTQQLIAGGRHPHLRDRSTLSTLQTLAEGGWISPEASGNLTAAYLFLRCVEHRLQMIGDEQTHTLPTDIDELERFARFLGYSTLAEFVEIFLKHLRNVQRHYAELFEAAPAPPGTVALVFPDGNDDRETLDALSAMGFRNPLEISAKVRGWLAGQYPALRGEFARAQLGELVPMLFERLARMESRDTAITAFDRFLTNLHGSGAGGLFSLLRQNSDLLSLILLILGTAPRLADILSHHPQVMDALVDPTFFGLPADSQKLHADLSRALAEGRTYEDFLDRLRIFGQEQMFLTGVRILSGTLSAEQAGDTFARLAEVVIQVLDENTQARFVENHGRIAGQKTALLALGKLGGREMTATSDLDLILIYDFEDAHPESSGPKPLYGAQYFARMTQRLIGGLTAQTNYGALYAVDMRLRPSGRSGPVATKIDSFQNYQDNDAWTWEHMALTRARVIAADPDFAAQVNSVIRGILCRRRNPASLAADALEMRQAIAQEKPDNEPWNLKYAAGGLIDIEFIAQYLQLAFADQQPEILDPSTAHVLEKAARLRLLTAEDSDILRPAVRLYQNLSQILRLCLPVGFDPRTATNGLLNLLARAGDVPDFTTLEAHLSETQIRVRQSFLRILGNEMPEKKGRRHRR